jgi:hypothetical protein
MPSAEGSRFVKPGRSTRRMGAPFLIGVGVAIGAVIGLVLAGHGDGPARVPGAIALIVRDSSSTSRAHGTPEAALPNTRRVVTGRVEPATTIPPTTTSIAPTTTSTPARRYSSDAGGGAVSVVHPDRRVVVEPEGEGGGSGDTQDRTTRRGTATSTTPTTRSPGSRDE